MLLGLGMLQFVELLESALAYGLTATEGQRTITLLGRTLQRPLAEGVLVRLDAARYLYQFPLGVLATSLAVAVFPLLSRYASRGDKPGLRDALNRALRLAVMEGLATGAGLLVLAEPIVRLLYVRGGFNPDDAVQAAGILRMYVVGMWAFCTYQIFTRAFYSVKDTLTPMKVSCGLMLLELALLGVLVWPLGARAFGLTTAAVFTVNCVILAALLRRRFGPFGGRKLLVSVLRSLAATGIMVGVLLVLLHMLAGRSSGMIVGICVPAGVAAFVGAAWFLRAPELGELIGGLQRRGRRPAGE
jgi:putative peptidoglycan lipid II flippase